MSTPPSSPFDPALADSGRVPTLLVLWGIFTLATLPFFARLLQGQTEDLGRGTLYALGTALLLAWVWHGSVWAWRITVGLSMFSGVLVFMGGMLAGAVAWQGWLISGVGVGFMLLGAALVGLHSIRAFLDTRWQRRAQP